MLIWLNWSLDASLKLFMGREFCLHCRASLHQKLDAKNHTHSSKEQKHARRLQHPMQIASKRSTEDTLATAESRNLPTSTVQTGFPLVHYSSPISRPAAVLFHPFHFPTFPAAGSCLSTPACVCVCACSGPRDRRSHCWEIRSWFRFFGPTLCCWVKAVYIVFIAEDKGFLSQTLVFKTPSPPRSVPLLCPAGYFIPPFHKQ